MPTLIPARKVLVIDDEEAFCVLLARMLSKLGYKVLTSNSAQSVQLDEMTDADILFLDMKMPEMSGREVLDFLISHKISSAVVLMSGADIEALTEAEKLSTRSNLRLIGVLDKPFRESDVRAILEE